MITRPATYAGLGSLCRAPTTPGPPLPLTFPSWSPLSQGADNTPSLIRCPCTAGRKAGQGREASEVGIAGRPTVPAAALWWVPGHAPAPPPHQACGATIACLILWLLPLTLPRDVIPPGGIKVGGRIGTVSQGRQHQPPGCCCNAPARFGGGAYTNCRKCRFDVARGASMALPRALTSSGCGCLRQALSSLQPRRLLIQPLRSLQIFHRAAAGPGPT